jgi:hypothetical protein
MADQALAAALSSMGLDSGASLASLPLPLLMRIFAALGPADLARRVRALLACLLCARHCPKT